ncbi:hypothetical protein T4E_1962 [Trichinella pseudospiralis]|nr:hypothetical protein T4E_1962 [Trichinella pseudospiralis]
MWNVSFADGVTIRCQREPVVADSLNQSKHRLGAERAGAERWNRAATSPIQIVYGQAQLQQDVIGSYSPLCNLIGLIVDDSFNSASSGGHAV